MAIQTREQFNVQKDETTVISGVVTYSRNALHRLEGEALKRVNDKLRESRTKAGKRFIERKAGFRITIKNPIFETPNQPLAQYMAQHIYEDSIELENSGKYAPRVYISKPDGTAEIANDAKQIPAGTHVRIVLRAFATSYGLSSGFDAILVPEGTDVFTEPTDGSSTQRDLAAFGINVVGGPAQANTSPVQQAQNIVNQNNQGTSPFAQPTGQSAPAFQPFQQSAPTAAPQQNAYTQPAQSTTPFEQGGAFGQQSSPFPPFQQTAPQPGTFTGF